MHFNLANTGIHVELHCRMEQNAQLCHDSWSFAAAELSYMRRLAPPDT